MSEPVAARAAGPKPNSAALAAGGFKARSIDLYLSSVCNRRCSFCFLSDAFLNSRTTMPFDMAERIISWAKDGKRVEEITILGGEPATHPDFARVIAVAKRNELAVRTVTNGSPQFRATLSNRAVAESLNRVAVSVDSSHAERMDRLRGRGAYEDAMSTIRALSDAKIPFDINCTVLQSCLDDFPDMLKFAEDLGAKRLNVHWFSVVGRAREHAPGETVSAKDWRERVLAEVERYQPRRADYIVDCELAYAYNLPGEKPDACAVRERENLQFFPSGAVFSCGLLVEDETLSGYVWTPEGLFERAGSTELTQTKGCGGCPFRADEGGYSALCIYSRLLV